MKILISLNTSRLELDDRNRLWLCNDSKGYSLLTIQKGTVERFKAKRPHSFYYSLESHLSGVMGNKIGDWIIANLPFLYFYKDKTSEYFRKNGNIIRGKEEELEELLKALPY